MLHRLMKSKLRYSCSQKTLHFILLWVKIIKSFVYSLIDSSKLRSFFSYKFENFLKNLMMVMLNRYYSKHCIRRPKSHLCKHVWNTSLTKQARRHTELQTGTPHLLYQQHPFGNNLRSPNAKKIMYNSGTIDYRKK